MRRWLKVAGIGLGALVVIVLVLGWTLLGTASGARFVLDRLLPGDAQVGTVEGSLWGPLMVADVRYRRPGLELTVARVRLEWRPTRLIRRTLDITGLHVDTVRARTWAADAPPDTATGGGRPSVPLHILLRDLRVRDARVVMTAAAPDSAVPATGDTVGFEVLAGALSARADTFVVDSVRLRGVRHAGHRLGLRADGRAVTGADADRDTGSIGLTWDGELASGRRLVGEGSVVGAGGRYDLRHRLSAPAVATFAATVTDMWTDTLRWHADLDLSRVVLSTVDSTLQGEVEGRVEARGAIGSFRADVSARGSYPGLGALTLESRLAWGGRVLTLDTVLVRETGGPGTIQGGGRIELADPVAGDLRLAWTDLAWPRDTPAVSSSDGSLTLTGSTERFDATLAAGLARPDQPLGRWRVRARGAYTDTFAARLDWSGQLPDRPGLAGSGRVRYTGDRVIVPELVVRIAEDRGTANFEADVALGEVPRGRAVLRWSGVAWPRTEHADAFTSPEGRVEASGAMSDFSVVASADFAGWSAPPSHLDLELRGSADTSRVEVRVRGTGVAEGSPAVELRAEALYRLAEHVLRVDTVDVRLPETDGRLAGRVEADLDDPGGRIAGRVRWQRLGWPLYDPVYRSDEGGVTAQRGGGEVRLSANAHLGGTDLPESRWRLAGHGDPGARFVVDSLSGRLLDGEIEGSAVIWADSGPAWQLTLTGDSLDPGVWRPAWPGRLRFTLAADGRVDSGATRYAVRLDSLTGMLRDRRVAAAARASGAGADITVDTLWLRSGESRVEAAGVVGDTIDLGWRLEAETLADLVPGATGRLTARGSASGPTPAPTVMFAAAGRTVGLAGWAVDTLSAAGDFDTGADRSSVTADLAGIAGPSLALDSLTLDGSGTRADHEVTVVAAGPSDRLVSHLAGGLADNVWTGRLERLALRSSVAGGWQLRTPAPLVFGRDNGSVGELCWVGSGELCFTAAWDAAGVRWQGTGEGLPMAFLAPVLPQGVALRGEFGLETRGTAGPGSTPRGVFRFTGQPGQLEYTRDVDRVVTHPYRRLAIDVTSDSAAIEAAADLDLGDLGSLRAEARLHGAGPVGDRAVEGRLTASLQDSGAVSGFVPLVVESTGRAAVDLEASGTVAAPEVRGRISLTGVSAGLPAAGIRLREGELLARSTPAGPWELEGGVRSDTGRIEVAGSFRLPTPDSVWRLQLDVTGDRFRAVRTPELLITASPRLAVRATPELVRVDGELRVPRARIAVRRLEGNVEVSPDVVVLGAEESGDPAATSAALGADVRLVLGDRVSIDALGLTGRLGGQLTVLAEPGQPPVGSGELGIFDGRYRIYRQTFEIERGRLFYAGTPLTNPALDLRIVRRRSGVVVGMDVTGRADDPRVQLFSDPTLSDDEILAYLIAGRPVRRLTQSEGSQVRTMAESIGVAGGNLLLARLSAVFGLEQARLERTTTVVEGGTTRRETSLVLGRQILPRVQLDYAIGLINTANVIRLRYRISDRWILQTESGEETGADLLYTIEY